MTDAAATDQPALSEPAVGPVLGSCDVAGHRRLGDYHVLALQAPEVAARASPGQFVSLGVGAAGTVLRRPFSIAAADSGTVELVFEVVGPGTAWLADRRAGDRLDAAGPLGSAFTAPPRRRPALLVGGGYGSAPLAFLARRLAGAGHPVDAVTGAASAARLLAPETLGAPLRHAWVATEDGSTGGRGVVTELLDAALDADGAVAVYACGPMPMLAAVSSRAARRGLACQVAVEEAMACGVGVCWTCVIPQRRDGRVEHVRACLDGPVFDGATVAW
jgi:dihydroorotate dehydrogenase electron transfer subunit